MAYGNLTSVKNTVFCSADWLLKNYGGQMGLDGRSTLRARHAKSGIKSEDSA